MQTTFKKTFAKDFSDLPNNIKDKVESFVNDILPNADSILDIKHIKKLKGTKSFYRYRIADYRIGFELRNNEVVVYRVLHRSKIYKYFP